MRKIPNEELGRMSVEEFRKAEKSSFVIVLDNVRSHNNVGSVFRTADAFLTKKIYLCGITARPPHRDIQKTALGATDSVEWAYFEKTTDAIRYLRSEGYKIIGIEQVEGSVELQDFIVDKNLKYALVFGHESLKSVFIQTLKTGTKLRYLLLRKLRRTARSLISQKKLLMR